jgi:hypothetical protein
VAVGRAVAVPVAVVAEDALAARGVAPDLVVDDRQRADDVRVVRRQQPEPRVLQEARAMLAAASSPAISAEIVDGEKPLCSSQRSGPKAGPWAITKSAAGLMCCS